MGVLETNEANRTAFLSGTLDRVFQAARQITRLPVMVAVSIQRGEAFKVAIAGDGLSLDEQVALAHLQLKKVAEQTLASLDTCDRPACARRLAAVQIAIEALETITVREADARPRAMH